MQGWPERPPLVVACIARLSPLCVATYEGFEPSLLNFVIVATAKNANTA
jgi:hypothetical protein